MEPVDLTPIEQAVMQLMAHGVTRETIAEKIKLRQDGELRSVSPATIARAARSAADKVGGETIQHAVAVLWPGGRSASATDMPSRPRTRLRWPGWTCGCTRA